MCLRMCKPGGTEADGGHGLLAFWALTHPFLSCVTTQGFSLCLHWAAFCCVDRIISVTVCSRSCIHAELLYSSGNFPQQQEPLPPTRTRAGSSVWSKKRPWTVIRVPPATLPSDGETPVTSEQETQQMFHRHGQKTHALVKSVFVFTCKRLEHGEFVHRWNPEQTLVWWTPGAEDFLINNHRSGVKG